jgi:hypothetical protein
MPSTMDRESLEYRWWQVTTPNDLSTSGAQVAMKAAGDRPVVEDWATGTLVQENGVWWVRVLVGPGGDITLTPGDWQEWVRILDNPEQPLRKPGVLVIT